VPMLALAAKSVALLLIALAMCASCGKDENSQGASPVSLEFSVEQWSESQRKTSLCMKRLGFEYFPEPLESIDQLTPYLDVPLSESAGSARERNGYGILARQEAVVKRATVGKNAEYAKTLNSDERRQYHEALYGRSNGTERCLVTPLEDPEFQRKLARIGTSRKRFIAHRRVLEVDSYWVACMRSKGHSEAKHMWYVVRDVVQPEVDYLLKQGSLQTELKIARDDVDCYKGTLPELEKIRLNIEIGTS
jgi:hypothetical protein